MRLWIWRGLCMKVPDDWEMLQFETNTGKGGCAFADRYQFRFEVDWKVVQGGKVE